ncbi:benenodin family lasso peptide [Allosphingosinicella deserti]|nr:benenodin family lasso peptide [Sphingomonas deserti]
MEREDQIIDLGAASVETLGAGGIPVDEQLGQFETGLSDD